jgi:tetratricopeptide (TPR) repeat protein
LWYLLLLIPVLGFVSIGPHWRADRYTYLPQIGVTLALVWAVTRLAARWSLSRGALWAGAVAVLLALMACSWRQVGFWGSNQALWEHALECNPNNIYAHYMYAARLEKAGDLQGAANHYRQAVERWPREQTVYRLVRAESHNALGNFAERSGRTDEALDHYQAAWQWKPDSFGALLNLGRMLLVQGRVDEAIGHLQKCVELSPRDPRAYCALAAAFAQKGDIARGIAEYHRALDVAPGFGPAVRGVRSLMSEAGPGSSGQR